MIGKMHKLKARKDALAQALNANWAAWPTVKSGSAGPPEGARSRIDLAGTWERHVEGMLFDFVEVPSSLHPFGYYRLKRSFLLPRLSDQQRAVVHFDAINYHGRVFVNGVELGTTILYVPHEFEFTRQAREGTCPGSA